MHDDLGTRSVGRQRSVRCGIAVFLVTLAVAGQLMAAPAPAPTLVVPASESTLHVAVALPPQTKSAAAPSWRLVEADRAGVALPAQLIPAMAADGTVGAPSLVADVPPRQGSDGPRRFRLEPATAAAGESRFALDELGDRSLKLSDGGRPVLAYNFGVITAEQVPEQDHRRRRACYVHPLWGLHGEVLTDDFPADHYHHHGVFWTWPHIEIDGKHYDSWAGAGIEQQFVRWIVRQTGPLATVLAVENGWFVGQEKVMIERVWIRTYKAAEGTRSIDLALAWIPVDRPITLWGADGKSYGGLSLRMNVWPRRDAVVTHPGGTVKHEGGELAAPDDLANTPLPWADLTTHIPGAPERSGAAVFVHPEHPDYPPSWLTRCYGVLCVGWPGVQRQTFPPDRPIRTVYRILVHKSQLDVEALKRAYAGYVASTEAKWE